jgi:hypothetical protein
MRHFTFDRTLDGFNEFYALCNEISVLRVLESDRKIGIMLKGSLFVELNITELICKHNGIADK